MNSETDSSKNELYIHEIYNIYCSLKPTFNKMAGRFRVANPEKFVDEWLSKAFLIANKADAARTGPLQVSELRNFRGYLVTSFKNDLIKDFHAAKKEVMLSVGTKSAEPDFLGRHQSFDVADLNQMPETEGYRVSDVRSTLAFSVMENNKNITGMTRPQYVEHCFQYSLYVAALHLEQKLNNPVLCGLDNKAWDLSSDSTPEIHDLIHELSLYGMYALGKIALNEFCPSTQGDILDKIDDSGYYKSILRFFADPICGLASNIETSMDGFVEFTQTKTLKIVPDQKLKLAKKYRPDALNTRKNGLAADADVKIRNVFSPVIAVNQALLEKRLVELKNKMPP